MAEPEKKIEIEDVLSSIRRLVAQDPAPLRSAPAPVPSFESPTEEAAPALVLTQSDRVEEPTALFDEEEVNESLDMSGTFDAPEESVSTIYDPEPEGEREAEPAESEESLDQDWEEAVSQSTSGHEWSAPSDAEEAPLAYDAEESADDFTEESTGDLTEGVLQLEPHMQTQAGSLADAGGRMPLYPASSGEFEAEEGDPAPLSGALSAFGRKTADTPAFTDVPPSFGADEADFADFASEEEATPLEAEAVAEELETASGIAIDEAEPLDVEGSDDPDLAESAWSSESPQLQDEEDWQPEEDLPPELEAAAEALMDEVADTTGIAAVREATRRLHLQRPETELLAAEEEESRLSRLNGAGGPPVFDEEALRLMVGRMIRAELQGALGAQITQKVRRLVRQEINRALISREFE